jgi:hypothetical protein
VIGESKVLQRLAPMLKDADKFVRASSVDCLSRCLVNTGLSFPISFITSLILIDP